MPVCRPENRKGFVLIYRGHGNFSQISPLQVEHPTPGAGGLKEAARPNSKGESLNHARTKRCRGKWAQHSAERVCAMMVKEKRNCKRKYRRGVIRQEAEE